MLNDLTYDFHEHEMTFRVSDLSWRMALRRFGGTGLSTAMWTIQSIPRRRRMIFSSSFVFLFVSPEHHLGTNSDIFTSFHIISPLAKSRFQVILGFSAFIFCCFFHLAVSVVRRRILGDYLHQSGIYGALQMAYQLFGYMHLTSPLFYFFLYPCIDYGYMCYRPFIRPWRGRKRITFFF